MKCYFHGGFISESEYFEFLHVVNNTASQKKSGLCLVSSRRYNQNKKAEVKGYVDSLGGVLRYFGSPTREQRLEEARDAFVHQDWQTPMYKVLSRKYNSKGETVGISLFRKSKINQIGLILKAKAKILLNKLILL